MSLNLYTALIKQDEDGRIEDISLSKNSFSFSAFFFSFFWFLFHAMWKGAIIFAIAQILIIKSINLDFIGIAEVFLLQVGLYLCVAVNARSWYSRHLQKNKGYKKMGYFLAENEEDARLKSMKAWHRNSPDLNFSEISKGIIDPDFYLKSISLNKIFSFGDFFNKILKRWQVRRL